MATPPTFSVGGVLTAAQMNQVSLWGITPTSVSGGSVSGRVISLGGQSTRINGVFTSDFANYRMHIRGLQVSSNAAILFRMSVGGSSPAQGWQTTYRGLTSGGGSADFASASSTYTETGIYIGIANTPIGWFMGDFFGPQLAQRTTILSTSMAHDGSNFFQRTGGSVCDNTTQYDGIEIWNGNGANMTGTVTIYGYN